MLHYPGEEVVVAVIVAELDLLQEVEESLFGHPMMFGEPSLGVGPKAFHAVDLPLPRLKRRS